MNKDLKDKIARLKELAGKATQGEWGCAHNPVSGFNASYACIGPFPRKVPSANTLTDLINLNTAYALPVCVVPYAHPVLTDKTDPLIEEQRANAAYIGCASPAAITELIAELERLQKDNKELWDNNYGPEILNDPQVLTACYLAGAQDKIRETGKKIEELQAENRQLEKEADWLAATIARMLYDSGEILDENDSLMGILWWRERARKAVKEKE